MKPFGTRQQILACAAILAFLLGAITAAWAQGNMTVYDDSLKNGWQDHGYATENYGNAAPVHSGNRSISVTISRPYAGIQIYHTDLATAPYASISFWLNGGEGGQQLQMYAMRHVGPKADAIQSAQYPLSAPPANAWQQYTVPLSVLGAEDITDFTGFGIQDAGGAAEPVFYLDDIQLNIPAPPTPAHLTVNASKAIRTADARWFGMNATTWDINLDAPQTLAFLTNMGVRALRFPGGSVASEYHWVDNRQNNNDWKWPVSLADFIHLYTDLGAQAMITVNYGTGTANEAAAWVAYANASTTNTLPLGADESGVDWKTVGYWASVRASAPLAADDGKNFLRISRSAPIGFKYWEIGNEAYGSWEPDSTPAPHDPYAYAFRARHFIALMKAVDPAIKTGVMVRPGEDSYANNPDHPVVNPRTGASHNGWTPVVLATLTSLGITPDFVVHHYYPENPGHENDALLLAGVKAWTSAATNLRRQITDYVGPGGSNIELICTENATISSKPGKQSASLVGGLYRADSMAQLMQTEFKGLFWWALRNGPRTNDVNNSPSLYGWRQYGDYGVVAGLTDIFPAYYTSKLMRDFVQPGDTVVAAASDNPMLSAYAVRRLDGRLTILAINKDPANTIEGQLALSGFTPLPDGAIYSYGIPQDKAEQTGVGSPDIVQTTLSNAAANFSYSFPPYSATVLALSGK